MKVGGERSFTGSCTELLFGKLNFCKFGKSSNACLCVYEGLSQNVLPHSSGFNLTRRNNVPDSSSSANVTYMLHVKRKISYSVGNNFKLLPVAKPPNSKSSSNTATGMLLKYSSQLRSPAEIANFRACSHRRPRTTNRWSDRTTETSDR